MGIIESLPTPKRRQQTSTIELLREMLEEAEAGQITEVVIFGWRPNGDTILFASPVLTVASKIGALEAAKFGIFLDMEREP